MKTWQIYVYGGLALAAVGLYLLLKEQDEYGIGCPGCDHPARVLGAVVAEPPSVVPPAPPLVTPEPLPPATAEVAPPA